MNIRLSNNPAIFIILISAFMMIAVAPAVFAGGPAPGLEGVIFEGKAVDGVLNAVVVDPDPTLPDDTPGSEPYVVQYIIITCKEAEVVYGPSINFPSSSPGDLNMTTAECPGDDPLFELCIEGWIFEGAAAEAPQNACFPEAEAGLLDDIIITKVKNFVNTGTAISAEVTLRLGQQ